MVTAIYHPPYSLTNNITNATFLDELTEWVTELIMENKNVIILGDLNMRMTTQMMQILT